MIVASDASTGERRSRITDAFAPVVLADGRKIGFLPEHTDPEEIGPIRRARVFAGHAGWGPGQLEAELEQGSWLIEPALPDDVFHPDPRRLWDDVLRRKGRGFEVLRLMPEDPSTN